MSVANIEQALAIVRQLPQRDQMRLIALIAHEIATEPVLHDWPPPGITIQLPNTPKESLPLLRGGTWDVHLPLRREDLYDDRGRA
nr:hypothetical protein [Oscillochloris trichoides]